jgi:hypothetical protein
VKLFGQNIGELVDTIASITQVLRYSYLKPPRMDERKNSQKKMLVLGNGPSFRNDIQKIISSASKYDIAVVNNFAFSDEYSILQPKYYVFADSGYWLDELETTEECIRERRLLFNQLKTKTNWEISLFFPGYVFKRGIFQKEFSNYSNIKVFPMNTVPFKGYTKIKYLLFNKNLAMPPVQNVLVATLFLGINLGYKKLFLLGSDHNWTELMRVNQNNEVCLLNNHFYDKAEVKLSPWKKSTGEQYLMNEILYDLSKMFAGYIEIRNYAKLKGVEVFNSCTTSFIDAFERKPLE